MVTRFRYPERFDQFSSKCPPNAVYEKIGSSEEIVGKNIANLKQER
jgi:hypothetical protein